MSATCGPSRKFTDLKDWFLLPDLEVIFEAFPCTSSFALVHVNLNLNHDMMNLASTLRQSFELA